MLNTKGVLLVRGSEFSLESNEWLDFMKFEGGWESEFCQASCYFGSQEKQYNNQIVDTCLIKLS